MKGQFLEELIEDLKLRPLRSNHGTPEELMALARSWIKRAIHPIVVRRDKTVADGHRRIWGLKLLGETKAMVFVTDEMLTDADLDEIGLATAMHRADLPAYDQSVACRDWQRKTNATAKELAEKIDRDPSTISKLLALWRTVPSVQNAAQEGKISVKAWYQISLAPNEQAQEGLLALHLSNASASEIEAAGRKSRTPSVPVAKVARIPVLLPGGVSVVLSGKDLCIDTAINALTDVLKAAKTARSEGLSARSWCASMADKARKS